MASCARPASCAKRALFGASMLGGVLAAASALAAPALPTGGHVAAGSASIGSAGATLTVSQSSSKAIVDWSSFSIGQGGTVQFDNGAGATLNRVTGTGVSSIDGLLSATGSVYLINPNGVIVGKTGVVNTGGSFVASTLDAAKSSFLAGGPLTFSGPSTASVINLGKVGSLGGNVGLIAAAVRNDGTITAPRGDVGLAAGTTVTLDDVANDGGGLFSVQVGARSTSATNTGAINAAAVELRAQQGNIYALAGNTGGVINANGVDASGGTIKLISTGGTTDVTGVLSARGANGAGGQIETSGEQLELGAASVDTHGGSWLLDPTNLIVDATAAGVIDGALASGDVTLTTSASGPPTGPAGSTGNTALGAGDILVNAPITWSTSSTLTLNAFAALVIEAPITVTGAGKVALDFNAASADAPGGLSFDLGPGGFHGSLSYAAGSGEGIAGQALTINGTGYTLLYSIADLAGISSTGTVGTPSVGSVVPSGDHALATSLISTASYTGPVIGGLYGTLEGLGNTITGLTVNDGHNNYVGLIGTLYYHSLVRDLGLVGGSVLGDQYVGDLVGFIWSGAPADSNGTVLATYATGRVSGSSYVGGLAGYSWGTIEASRAAGAVSGGSFVGGLVGDTVTDSTVETSYATGAVSGTNSVGGLVGLADFAAVKNDHATGAATGSGDDVGGLIGSEYNGPGVQTSYATGAVSGRDDVGGLIGLIALSDGEPSTLIEASYATGAVKGVNEVGGLIGNAKFPTTEIEASYATGAVTGGSDVGGLIGGQNYGVSVETSYATGAVLGTSAVGGLIGGNGGTVTDSYWDTDTTGQSSSAGGTGLTTAQLQSDFGGYMANLNSGGAAFAGGTGGLYPYLTAFFPFGVQAITGTTTASGQPVGGLQVGIYSNGVLLGGGLVSAGANGYVYTIVPADKLGASGDKIGVALFDASVADGLIYTDAGSVSAGFLTLPTLAVAQTTETTGELTYSALQADLGATFGATNAASLQAALNGRPHTIDATGAGFTVDQSVSTARLTIETGAGDALTIVDPITLTGSSLLALDAGGALDIDAPMTVTGAGKVVLTNGAGGLSFDLGPAGFAGSLSYATGTGEGIAGQALTINGASYTLLYSMADLAGLDNGTGRDALAAPVTASGVGTGAVIGVFYGTLEGLGHSISGLTINSIAGDYVGLIGELDEGGVVRDLGLSGGSIRGINYVGGLVGYNEVGATLDDVITRGGTITASGDDVGGLVGANNGAISGAWSTDTVDNSGAGRASGGLVGANGATGSIAGGNTSVGSVTAIGGVEVGGLVGLNAGSISGSSAAEQVVDNAHGYAVGGLVGFNAAGASIASSAANGSVLVDDNVRYVGGLAGYDDGAIDNDSSTTTVSAATSLYVGGIVGYNATAGTISSTYASGADINASGGAVVGGLAGYNGGSITDAYADMSVVLGGPFVGGMVGYNAGDVSTSWSSGEVAGTSASVGGAIGDQAGGTLTNDYWDEGTSGQSHATGLGGSSAGLTAIGSGTGVDPHVQATYTGFDFTTVWTIQPGVSRPYLRNPAPATPPN